MNLYNCEMQTFYFYYFLKGKTPNIQRCLFLLFSNQLHALSPKSGNLLEAQQGRITRLLTKKGKIEKHKKPL